MAKYADGENYGKSIDPTPSNILEEGTHGGKVRVFQDQYTFGATSMNSTDYIVVGGKLPTGSQVVAIKWSMGEGDTSASSTFIVGDEGDDNRYIETVGMSANVIEVGPSVAGGMNYTVTGTTDNYIRVGGSGNTAIGSGNTLKITIMYVVE